MLLTSMRLLRILAKAERGGPISTLKTFSLVVLLLLAACSFHTQSEDYDDETQEKAKASVEKFITNNYEEIESVDITNVYQSEMGGLKVDGTVNGGEARFSAGWNR